METYQSVDENLSKRFLSNIPHKKKQRKSFNNNNHKTQTTTDSAVSVKDTKLQNLFQPSEKQLMLGQLKSQESEISFLQTVVSNFIDINELFKIRQNSSYDPDTEIWSLPNFIIRQRRTIFPNLERGLVKETASPEEKERKLGFITDEFEDNDVVADNYRPATSCAQRRSKKCQGKNNYNRKYK